MANKTKSVSNPAARTIAKGRLAAREATSKHVAVAAT
jgi:hypothetical protein